MTLPRAGEARPPVEEVAPESSEAVEISEDERRQWDERQALAGVLVD